MGWTDILQRREPILYLVSSEESRAEADIQRYCEDHPQPFVFFRWSATRGLERFQGGVLERIEMPETPDARLQAQAPIVPVLNFIIHTCQDDGVFLLKDIHHFLRSGTQSFSPTLSLTCRAIRDAFYELRALRKDRKIVLLSPEMIVPTDLEKELRVYDLPLPSRADLSSEVSKMIRKAAAIHRKDPSFVYDVRHEEQMINALVETSVGLTQVEVEYALDNMLYVDRRVDADAPSRMLREKQQIIRKSGVMEYIPPEELQHLEAGGLDALLDWLAKRERVFREGERARKEYGITQLPRGVLLVGIPGGGKSLVCKMIARQWGLPLLRLDMGAIFDRFVGASEERMRRALNVAESVAPCILWLDEIEKGFSTGIGGDSGTSARVLGTFLVWMQEKKAPVFIAATANNINMLPAELLRSGRFDNRFFVGCPGDDARRQIFEIHLRARHLEPERLELGELVDLTFGYTGAEIEQIVLDSVYDAFCENRWATTDDLTRNVRRYHPLVKSMGPQIAQILKMLDQGRIELASAETIAVSELAARLGIELR